MFKTLNLFKQILIKRYCSNFISEMSKKVLIVNKTFPIVGVEALNKEVETVIVPYLDYEPESLPTITQRLKEGCDGIIWNTKHMLSKGLLDLAGPRLKVISTVSSGLDHVDVAEVKRRGIPLGNTLHVLDNAVADIGVGLLIAAARRFKEGVREVESGEWKYGIQWSVGRDIANSTVGIVGLGGIGQAIVRRLKGFDVGKFLYCGRSDKPEAKALGVERVPQEQLFRESDFIVLACPLTEETRHLINADAIKLMKETAIVLNVGRGGLVDQDALLLALEERRIFAAGLDVTTPEPLSKDHPLVKQPFCYILPHMGSATVETRNSMASIAAANVLQALNGKPMRCPAYSPNS